MAGERQSDYIANFFNVKRKYSRYEQDNTYRIVIDEERLQNSFHINDDGIISNTMEFDLATVPQFEWSYAGIVDMGSCTLSLVEGRRGRTCRRGGGIML
jgi:hypothetical protein